MLLDIDVVGVVTTLAGGGGPSSTEFGNTDGVGSAAPYGIAVSTLGTVYVADTENHLIRIVSLEGQVLFLNKCLVYRMMQLDLFAGVVTTLAGGGSAGGTASGSVDGTVSVATFSSPNGIAVSTSGTVYVADTGNHIIRMISPTGIEDS